MNELLICLLPIGALLLFVFGAFTKNQRRTGFKRANGKCEDCGADWNEGRMLEADHIIPEALGGGDTLDNMRFRCLPCHAQKHEDDAHEAEKRGDEKSARVNAWAARQIRKRSIWRRGHEPADDYEQGRLF